LPLFFNLGELRADVDEILLSGRATGPGLGDFQHSGRTTGPGLGDFQPITGRNPFFFIFFHFSRRKIGSSRVFIVEAEKNCRFDAG